MSQHKVRARDDDRDAAIELVEAAWADGQLARGEYEQRVEKLLRAPTLRELEIEIADLQPEGVTWQPPSSMVAPVAVAANPVENRSPVVLIAVALTGIIATILVVRSLISSAPPSPITEQDPVAASTSLLTPASFNVAREELERQAGSDAVYSAVLTKGSFVVVRPTSATGADAIQSSWDGQWSKGSPTSSSGERLSLGLVNAEAVATIRADARQRLGKEAELQLLFQIEHHGDRRVCITATGTADANWTGTYDCRGQKVGS